jgi:hypothetical protein
LLAIRVKKISIRKNPPDPCHPRSIRLKYNLPKEKKMETENKEIIPENKEVKKKKKSSWLKFLAGDILTEDFVTKQSKMIVWVVLLIVLFISNRYACVKKLAEIQELNMELKYLQYENMSISTELTTRSRQSQIEEILEIKGIELSMSKTPAIEIHK